jgi:hypothetical protein
MPKSATGLTTTARFPSRAKAEASSIASADLRLGGRRSSVVNPLSVLASSSTGSCVPMNE